MAASEKSHERKPHPMQPLFRDCGVVRFKPNAIVKYLASKVTLVELYSMPFSEEDREQFVQLLGYSVDGFRDLSFVRRPQADIAAYMRTQLKDDEKHG